MSSRTQSLAEVREQASRELDELLQAGDIAPEKLVARAAELRHLAADTDQEGMRASWLEIADRYDSAARDSTA